MTQSYSDLIDAVPGYALKTAATLRIADHVADGNRTLPELARATRTVAHALERLMRYLCCRDIFAWTTESGYLLTPFSRLLLDDHPAQLRRSLDLDGHSGRMDQAIAQLPAVIRTGKASYPTLYGHAFYDDYASHSELEAQFAGVRQRQAYLHGKDIAHSLEIAARTHIVDVGGGTGALMAALLDNRQDLTGAVFDLPGLQRHAAATFDASSAGDRMTFVAGDFFDKVPAGGLHILCNTIFNWDDMEATIILRSCLAASTTGRVLIVEQVLHAQSPTEEELALDLRNLAINGGRQRNRDQFCQIARAAGLRVSTVTALPYRNLFAIELVATAEA